MDTPGWGKVHGSGSQEGPRGAMGGFVLMLPAPLCGDAGWLHPSLLGDFLCWGGLVLLLPAPLCGDAGR